MSRITRTVLVLSLVSLFNDISSEMLYPVMPVYLKSIGFTIFWIGLLEGIAEATAGLSKIYFGKLSDEKGARMPFVRLGYLLSSFSKPMLWRFAFPLWIFSVRTLDRFGKGLRTGARDALLSDETIAENKGTVFGFHRAFDTIGAATGPAIALIYLYFFPNDYRTLFLIAFVPAILSVLLTFFIKEKKKAPAKENKKPFLENFFYWKQANKNYRQIVGALLLFGIMNSSDVFLLLMIKQKGFSDEWVIGAYIFYNLIYALASYPLGRIGDKLGLKKVLILGLFIFSIVYAGFAINDSLGGFFVLYFLYGIYMAATEGISKALISNIAPRSATATAIGFYTGWNSICILIASSVTGFIFYKFSPSLALSISAAGSLLVAVYLLNIKSEKLDQS